MTIEEANISLKLECALRQLGFMEIKERIVAHAGLYFVRPVGFFYASRLWDDLLGFQIEKLKNGSILKLVYVLVNQSHNLLKLH